MGLERCTRRKLERGRLLGGWNETRGSSRWRRHLDLAIHSSASLDSSSIGRSWRPCLDGALDEFHLATERRFERAELDRGNKRRVAESHELAVRGRSVLITER